MSNNSDQPNQGGWRFDPQTGQPVQPVQPAPQQDQPVGRFDPQTGQPLTEPVTVQPQQPAYVPPQVQPQVPSPQPAYTPPQTAQPETQGYVMPTADPNAQPGYRVQPESSTPYAPPPVQPAPAVVVTEQKKRSNPGLIVGLVVLALVVAGVGGAAYFLSRTINAPAVAVERILPANVLGYFSVNPALDGSQKVAMDKMKDAFQSQPGFKEAWNKITSQAMDLGSAAGMATPAATPAVGDLDALSSYLGGNLTIAMLPPSTDDLQKLKDASSNGGDMGKMGSDVLGRNVVGMVDLDFNPLNKKGPIADFKQQTGNGGKLELVEQYRGMDIRKYVTGTNTLYFALLDGSSTAVVGAKVEPLKLVMDGYKDNKGLKDSDNFKALSGQVPGERIASLYLNLTEIYKQLGFIAPEASSSVQKVDGATLMTLSAKDDGMQVDIASQADFANNVTGQNSSLNINPNAKPDVATLSDIPAGSLGFLLGTDLKSVIQTSLDAARKQGGDTAKAISSTEQQVQEATGKDLEKDILPLMGGDYALSASPAKADNPNPPLSAVIFQMKIKPADRDKALEVLAALATKTTNDNAQKFEDAGGTFYSLGAESPSTPVLGVTGDRMLFVMGTGADSARDQLGTITSGFGKGLGATDAWRATAKHLPTGSNLVGYLDVAALRNAAEQTMSGDSKQEYEQNAAPFLRPFKYILLGSSSQAPATGTLSRNHTVFFLGISK